MSNNYGNVTNNDILDDWANSLSADPLIGDGRLIISANSPSKGTGENGSDIGANIQYRYQDGVLTTEPLWPWPMQQRIMDELGIDVMGELEALFSLQVTDTDNGDDGSTNPNGNFNDTDNDGVIDEWDNCPNTPNAASTDKHGCKSGFTQAEIDAAIQACISNPASCGIVTNAATVTADLNIHIPYLDYDSPLGEMKLWANFEFTGETNGEMFWKLKDFGQQ